MHKKLKLLIKNMKDVFDIDEINEIVKETKLNEENKIKREITHQENIRKKRARLN